MHFFFLFPCSFPHVETKCGQRILNVYAWGRFIGVSRTVWVQVVPCCIWGVVPKLEASRIAMKGLQRVMMGRESEGWDEGSWSLFHRNKAECVPKLSEGWLSIRLGDLAWYLSCRYNFLLKGTVFFDLWPWLGKTRGLDRKKHTRNWRS